MNHFFLVRGGGEQFSGACFFFRTFRLCMVFRWAIACARIFPSKVKIMIAESTCSIFPYGSRCTIFFPPFCCVIFFWKLSNFLSSCLEKLITKKERQMKLTRFIFSRRFEVIVTPLSSDKYLQVLEFK